jgi:hypothetical protein
LAESVPHGGSRFLGFESHVGDGEAVSSGGGTGLVAAASVFVVGGEPIPSCRSTEL